MSEGKGRIDALMKRATAAAELILEQVEGEKTIHIVSHIDADGIAAAGIIGKSLLRLGATFRLRATKWVDERMVDEIAAENPSLTIFTDVGSGYLDLLGEKLPNRRVIILDHHQPVSEPPESFIQVNPHPYGIDGSRDISGAGVTYLVAKALDKNNVDLSHLAVVGSLGDLQDKYPKRKLGGVNKKIVDDAIKAGCLTVETDLLLFGRETRPIHKALAYTMNPFIPGISGQEDRSLALLVSLGIKIKNRDRWRALRDLSEEEKKKLFSAVTDYLVRKGFSSDFALGLIGNVYTLAHEEPWTPLRDAREFTVLLNATGRMSRAGHGISVCMGDRGKSLEEANTLLREYRRTISKYLDWINEDPSRMEEMNSICVVHGEGYIDEKVISPVASILSTSLPNSEKPIIVYSIVSGEDMVKVSARGFEQLIRKGLDLGEVLRIAAESHSGRGGGHNIAAGAQITVKEAPSFLKLVDDLVKKQLEGKPIAS